MIARSTVLGLLALLWLGVSCAEDVLTVTGDNFEEVVTSNPNLVVEFYAPWCGHCKKLAPEFEKAASMLLKKEPKIVLAKCDATDEKNKPLAKKYDVKGFPTLKVFHGSSESADDYNGPREANGIVDYVVKTFGPVSINVTDSKSHDALMKHDVVALGVFPDKDSADLQVFLAAAKVLRDELDFGHTIDVDLVPKCTEVKCDVSKVMVFVPGEDIFEVYSGKFDKEALIDWLEVSSTPKLPVLDSTPRMQKVLSKIFATKRTRLVAFAKEGYEHSTELKQIIMKTREGETDIDIIYAETPNNDAALKYFGVKDGDMPAFVAHDPEKNLKYLKTGVKPSELPEFLQQLKAGLLEANMKSEDPPKKNDGPVKIVTGKTYKELVQDSGKKVLLEFYAPWCGHCKKLAPVYEQVGKHFKGNGNVVIAKIDATANDIPDPDVKITGFPTIKLFYGDDGKIVDYSGSRSMDDLIKFVKKHSAAPEEEPEEDEDDYVDDTDDAKTEL